VCGHVTGIDPEIDAHCANVTELTLNQSRDILQSFIERVVSGTLSRGWDVHL